MGDREQLLGRVEEARRGFLAAVEGLTEEQMTRPAVGEWSVKDLLCHLASYEEMALPDMERVARGDAPALGAFDLKRVDEYNALIMALRRHFSLEQAWRELENSRRSLLEAIGRLPDSALAEGQFARGMLQICAYHDTEHTEDVQAWRRREEL
jgi:uncharacterized damage-inducible protein DinB